jgi:hypothetical protein
MDGMLISFARAVASGSLESSSPGVPICSDPDASTCMGLWRFQHWHGFIPLTSESASKRQIGVRNRYSIRPRPRKINSQSVAGLRVPVPVKNRVGPSTYILVV